MAMRFALILMISAAVVTHSGAWPAQAQSSAGSALRPMTGEAVSTAKPLPKREARPVVAATSSVEPMPQPVPKPILPAKPETKPEPIKSVGAVPVTDVFAGIPQDERLKLQAALLWSGDYDGAAGNEDPMLTAIKNFQKRKKYNVTGVLTAAERSELVGAAREREAAFGWTVVVDPLTGIRIGLPAKMVPNAREAAHGTRWSSAHGEMQVETFRLADPDLKLPTLFEREKTAPNRRVEYSVLRDDGYFVSGLQGLKKFSVRAQMRDGEVRGFTLLFDQAMEGIVAPVMVAMASAFSPFPRHSAPFAALAKTVEYGNGVVVSGQGHIVTDARLTQGCQVIVAAGLGDADRVAEDKSSGLALLRVYGPRAFKPLFLSREATAGDSSDDVTLTGIPDPKDRDGRGRLAEIKARLVGNAIELREPAPMAGFSGAAALDGNRRFLGLTEMRSAVLASIEPAAPPVRLVRAAAIRDFVDAHNVPTVAAPSGEVTDSVVRIICVRK